MAFKVRVLQRNDESILSNVAPEVFDNPIDPNFAREFLQDPRHHIAVAIDDGVVIGFASGVHYVHPDKEPEMWINEVGVAPTHRRRGVAREVLVALLQVARSRNCSNAWVLTDESNEAAVALYTSLGGIEGAESNTGLSERILGYSFVFDRDAHSNR
jgi:aminoglycoside 6'-N-acetyltransferase I